MEGHKIVQEKWVNHAYYASFANSYPLLAWNLHRGWITQDLFLVSKQAVCITDLDVRIFFSQLFYVTHLSQHVWCTKQGERALRLNRKLA